MRHRDLRAGRKGGAGFDLKNLQNFAHGLIELAGGKFEMLLPHETTDLTRLRGDRHLCAHPNWRPTQQVQDRMRDVGARQFWSW